MDDAISGRDGRARARGGGCRTRGQGGRAPRRQAVAAGASPRELQIQDDDRAPALPAYARAVDVADAPDVLFTPSDGYVRYIPPVAGVAWLPEYPAWPGQWALPFGHDYQVPWYAQPYGYGCGHDGYGYC